MQQARYADAYAVARAVNTVGTVLKFAAAGAFSLIFAAGAVGVLVVVSARGALTADRFIAAAAVGISATVIASVAGLALFVTAMLLCAQAQTLSATLDTAVNSSGLITEEERARLTNFVPHAMAVARIPIGA